MKKYFQIKNYLTKLKSIFGKKYTITYSQTGEDIIMYYLCKSLGILKPTYIDVGAFHPQLLSNTYLFYKLGSSGINIEPNKQAAYLFKKVRPRDTNLSIAISDKIGLSKYYMIDAPTLNTLSQKDAESYVNLGHKIIDTYEVQTSSLSEIVRIYCNDIFPDILSLDTEGYDMKILQTIDWNRSKPKIICVETAEYSTKYKNTKNDELISWIKDKGYTIHADTHINTIFIQNQK